MPRKYTRVPANTTCAQCGVAFRAIPCRLGERNYCSRRCFQDSMVGRPITPIAERFWEKVEKSEGCWLWTASTNGHYGQIGLGRVGAGNIHTHRLSWELHYGAIPDGLYVLHHCDTPLCVKPDHLWLGTHADNMRDMVSKRRHAKQREA